MDTKIIRVSANKKINIDGNIVKVIRVGSLAAPTFNSVAYSVGPKVLTPGANIETNASLSNSFSVILGENSTLDNPTKLKSGATYLWEIIQPSSGGPHTLALGSLFKILGATSLTLSTTADAVDLLTGYYDGTKIRVVLQKEDV